MDSHLFSTLGVDIHFPYTPYGIQRAMMNRILLALTNRQHCLIESPTGTGKTLSLLCATLAWQRQSRDRRRPLLSKKYKEKILADRKENDPKGDCTCGRQGIKDKHPEKPPPNNLDTEKCKACLVQEADEIYRECFGEETIDDNLLKIAMSGGKEVEEAIKDSTPRIYYGTRTHKQISQVIREVNKTLYRYKIKMTILSSRDRTCIKEDVRNLATRNDKCMELMKEQSSRKGPGCPFYVDSGPRDTIYAQLLDKYDDRAWDIEDAAEYGREKHSCPFYGLRSLQLKADITFCPYNYILDSSIRQAMNINLKNAIIILDEAHNIEDTCRDSASFTMTSKNIEEMCELAGVAFNQLLPGKEYTALDFFKRIFQNILLCLKTTSFEPKYRNSGEEWTTTKTFHDIEMLTMLQNFGLAPSDLDTLKEQLRNLKGVEDNADDSKDQVRANRNQDNPALGSVQIQLISQLVLVLDYMYGHKRKYAYDYKMIMSRSIDSEFHKLTPEQKSAASGGPAYQYELKLACFNPGVAFETIKDLAWSVIVASGTLSPLDSLKTELGTEFGYIFEGAHVIGEDQLWATVIDKGPRGTILNCSYEQSNQLTFQDEVGAIVSDICSKVPNGVLCFFPSYQRMDTLYNRWTQTKQIMNIRKHKTIYRESKNDTVATFEKQLAMYNRDALKRGSLLMAVCRGKVSEGIDFSDNAARAVITIGIPYPNVQDTLVTLKKQYNDEKRTVHKTLLKGTEWYSGQAFRALNQALGRCIRHKEDWGAIIMIDSRLTYNVESLSRWVRHLIQKYHRYEYASEALQKFVEGRKAIEASKEDSSTAT